MTHTRTPGEPRAGRARFGMMASGLLLTLALAGCGGAQPAAQAPEAEPTIAATVGDTGATAIASPPAEPPPAEPAAADSLGATPEAALAACWPDGAQGATATTNDGEGGDMAQQFSAPPEMKIDPAKTYTATLTTNKGDIEVEFFPGEAPKTVNNFVCLAEKGYYDGTPFHRIVSGFVIQGGDPTGTGMGGPGYKFEDEPVSRRYTKGILAMANAGPNTNGSQFFIVTGADVGLPPNYTIFGQVTGGMDVVDALASTPTRTGRSGEKSEPTEAVTLEKVTVNAS